MSKWTPAEIEAVRELSAKGASAQRIAVRTNRTISAVRILCRELGIPLKSTRELRKSYGLRETWRANTGYDSSGVIGKQTRDLRSRAQ